LKTRDVTATVMALLRDGVARLEASGLPTARHDAERLLAGLTGTTRLALYLERDRGVQPETLRKYLALVERRAGHEPLQYLLGEDEFTGLDLLVRPGVFIPRPETEALVGEALDELGDVDDPVVVDEQGADRGHQTPPCPPAHMLAPRRQPSISLKWGIPRPRWRGSGFEGPLL